MHTLDELMKVISTVEKIEVQTFDGTYDPYNLPKDWHEYIVTNVFSLYDPSVKESYLCIEVHELEG